eukprot:g2431.t1
MRGTSRAPTPLLLALLVLCGLAFSPVRLQAATTNAIFKSGRSSSSSSSSNSSGPSREREPDLHVPSAAASLSREKSSLVAAAAHAAADGPAILTPHVSDRIAKGDPVAHPTPAVDENHETGGAERRRNGAGGGGGGGGDGDGDGDGRGDSPRRSGDHIGGASGAVDAGADDGSAAEEGSAAAGLISLAQRPVSLAERAKEKVAKTWSTVEVGMERAIHVRREVKAVFSSELERCLLKATRPENIAVDEACMQALLAQASRLSAVEACCDCDPHEVVCSKVLKKMMEQDWRTVAKALYVLHRLQRDSPPKEANRFSAFIRDQWAEGAGGLGKHMRMDGGMYAPWLKVYCGYLAARGLHLETATNAFRSWETLTSTRQLRNDALFLERMGKAAAAAAAAAQETV